MYTFLCCVAGIFVPAAIAYLVLNPARGRRERIMEYNRVVSTPPLGGVRYDFICCLRADGTGGTTTCRPKPRVQNTNVKLPPSPLDDYLIHEISRKYNQVDRTSRFKNL